MKTKMFYFLSVLCASAIVLGCGGKQVESNTAKMLEGEDEDVDLVSHLTGIDEQTAVEVEEEPEPELPNAATDSAATTNDNYIGGSQGAFLGTLKVNNETAEGSFTVKTASVRPEVVMADVKAGDEIKLDPGVYDFIFKTTAIVGEPEFTLRDVEITAGERTKRDVKIPTGKITLVTGRKCVKRPIKIKQKGATNWLPGKYSTCKSLILMAGEYEAEMGSGKRGTPISGIQVYDGGIREILIRKQ
jgi:hypothetical protein